MRILVYLDKACTIIKEIHEWFENRKDKMYKRVRSFLGGNNKFVEYYQPGGAGEVKQWTQYPGTYYYHGHLHYLSSSSPSSSSLSSGINTQVRLKCCVHYLCLRGLVYVFYLGHIDKIMKPFSML
jgi:hypothetical protein